MDLNDIPQETQAKLTRMESPLGIRFSHVNFSYTPESRQILQDFNYEFRPGTVTAIVGETGAGKTTLVKMLFSLVSPQSGRVRIYDSKGQEADITASERVRFCYVPQGNSLFSGTIRSNLLLGNPDATEKEMYDALQVAEANFVKESPQGLDTPCGETGDGLSEGQAQRIAIARALLSNGPILVLDEATSALDAQTEKNVLENLSAHFKQKTIIFITHRSEVLNHAAETLKMQRLNRKS